MSTPAYMTTTEFAAATGLPVQKITRLLREGALEGAKEAGKWKIPADQLFRVKPAEVAPEAAPGNAQAEEGKTYSVEELSAMTYLTPFGVTDWLKKGLLTGRKDDRGRWRVDAANLESDRVKRLLRR